MITRGLSIHKLTFIDSHVFGMKLCHRHFQYNPDSKEFKDHYA